MNVSRRWLESFLRTPLDSREVAAQLAMLGAPVDAIETIGADLSHFVVGLVTEVRQHPNADKLRVTTVDDGSGTLFNVVCGAPNVTAGSRYPFARLGTKMPSGLVIEKRKLRGETSEGMLCSARELGLGDDHDGLLTLEIDAAPGTPLTQVVDAGDERLVVDVTPNRADLLGHKGIARELGAALRRPIRLPDVPEEHNIDLPTPARFGDEAPVGGVRVAIEDRGCARLLVAVIRGVQVGPSPAWLRSRLASVGVRSINNIVDATNYIMFELNQPMHAYDLGRLHGPALVARTARPAERVTTLDGVDREIPGGALVIADADRVVGIAGVIGGENTEVTAATRDLLLECAWFEPARVRRTRRALDLSTEASHRFERGTDRWGAADALRRCIRLVLTVAGGALDGPAVDCYPVPTHPPRVFVRPPRVAQVLGIDVGVPEIERTLVAIGAVVVNKPDDGRVAVDIPGWRPDLASEIDLIEEVARVHGYDRVPADLRPFRPGQRVDDPLWRREARLRRALVAEGLSEVITLPMVDAAGSDPVAVLNPLSREHAVLREALVPSLLGQVEANWAQHEGDVRLFEIGTVFRAGPVELPSVAFVVTGMRQPAHWTRTRNAVWDAWDARALFESLVELAHPGARVQVADGDDDGWVAYDASGVRAVGRCRRESADAPQWAAPVYGGEVEIGGRDTAAARYTPTPTFPAVIRDLAIVLTGAAPVAAAVELLEQRGKRLGLERVDVTDEYRGPPLGDDQRSVTIRLAFRSPSGTLTDAQVDQVVGKLRQSLEHELGITVRSS